MKTQEPDDSGPETHKALNTGDDAAAFKNL